MPQRGPGGATGLLTSALRYALSVSSLVKPTELASPTPCAQWDIRALLRHLSESVADLEAGLRTGSLDAEQAPAPPRETRLDGHGLPGPSPARPPREAGRPGHGLPGPSPARLPGNSLPGLSPARLPGNSLPDLSPARPPREAGLAGHGEIDLFSPAGVLRERAAALLCACYDGGPAERFVVVGGLPLPAGIVACTGAVEIAVHGWDVSAALGRGGSIPPALATRLLALCPLLAASREGLFAPAVPVSPEASPGDRLLGYLGRDPGAPPWVRPEAYRPDHHGQAGTGTGQPGNWSRRLAAP